MKIARRAYRDSVLGSLRAKTTNDFAEGLKRVSFNQFIIGLARALAAGAGVAAASFVGIWIATQTQSAVSPFWPASGVAAGAVFLWRWPAVAGVFAGVLAFNIHAGLPGKFIAFGALALSAESALAAALARKFMGKQAVLDSLRGVAAVVLAAAWLPPLLNALLCANFMRLGDGTPFLSGAPAVTRFVLANGFGIALIMPAMLAWRLRPERGWWLRFAAVFAATVAATWFSFDREQAVLLMIVPILTGSVFVGLRGVSTVSAVAAVAIVVFGRLGFGRWAYPGSNDYSLVYSMFAVLAFGVLPVSAAIDEYIRLLRRRRAAEEAAGLRFWEWSDTDGLFVEGDEPAGKLFDAAKNRGSIETLSGGRDALSFWQVISRRADGNPRAAAGMLIDASDRLQLEKTRRKTWQSEVELRNLRAGLSPHLLFNCLAAVRGIVRTDPERARVFIDTLSRFLRETTDMQPRETVPLHEEWQLCERFLDLQSLRYERELPRLVEIDGPSHHAQLPPMMLLNFVENAVKHGEVNQEHPLSFRASLVNGHLIAEVRNHCGPHAADSGRAGGIVTARARLAAIYGPGASLTTSRDGENFCARLVLPATKPARKTATA